VRACSGNCAEGRRYTASSMRKLVVLGRSGGGVTACAGWSAWKRISVAPILRRSPWVSDRSLTRSPFTAVPLKLPRSRRIQPLTSRTSTQCFRDSDGSAMATAFAPSRPRTSSSPLRRNTSPAAGPETTISRGTSSLAVMRCGMRGTADRMTRCELPGACLLSSRGKPNAPIQHLQDVAELSRTSATKRHRAPGVAAGPAIAATLHAILMIQPSHSPLP
jgi:hypothetical protein